MKYTRLRHLLALSTALVLVTASAVEPAAAQACNANSHEFFVKNNVDYDVVVVWSPSGENDNITLSEGQCFRADTNGTFGVGDEGFESKWEENVLYNITVTVGDGEPYELTYMDCEVDPNNGPSAPANPCTNAYHPRWMTHPPFAEGSINDMFVTVKSNGDVKMGYGSSTNDYFTDNAPPFPTLWNLKHHFPDITVNLGFFSCLVEVGTSVEPGEAGPEDPRLAALPEVLETTSMQLTDNYAFGASNYPNPFNPATTIGYALPEAAQVRLEVFDLLGRSVARLVDRFQEAGSYEAVFEAADLPSGTYLYRLQAGALRHTGRMVLSK